MKRKIAFLLIFTLVFSFNTSMVFAVPNAPLVPYSEGCTTILVGKNATRDGSVLLAHNEDMGQNDVGRLWVTPAQEYDEGETVALPYTVIPQVAQTYKYWASGNWDKSAYEGDILVGLNEKGVAMACNTAWPGSKEPGIGKTGLKRYSIRQLILERATSARHAVDIITDLIDTYGQGGDMDLIYCLADPQEAWIVETTANHWVAKRVPDDGFIVVANQFTIGDDYDLASEDLVEYATEQGWWKEEEPGKLNFRKVYGKGLDYNFNKLREDMVKNALKKKVGNIGPEDLMALLRSHYEGTEKYEEPVHKNSGWAVANENRILCTDATQSGSVAHLRNDLPVEVGAALWFAMSTPCLSGFVPVFAGSDRVIPQYASTHYDFTQFSAWWNFDLIQRIVDVYGYEEFAPGIKEIWANYEAEKWEEVKELEREVVELFNKGEKDSVQKLLTQFTLEAQAKAYYTANNILKELVEKTEIGFDPSSEDWQYLLNLP